MPNLHQRNFPGFTSVYLIEVPELLLKLKCVTNFGTTIEETDIP